MKKSDLMDVPAWQIGVFLGGIVIGEAIYKKIFRDGLPDQRIDSRTSELEYTIQNKPSDVRGR